MLGVGGNSFFFRGEVDVQDKEIHIQVPPGQGGGNQAFLLHPAQSESEFWQAIRRLVKRKP